MSMAVFALMFDNGDEALSPNDALTGLFETESKAFQHAQADSDQMAEEEGYPLTKLEWHKSKNSKNFFAYFGKRQQHRFVVSAREVL